MDKSSKSTPPLKATAANSSKSIKRELLYASEQSEKRKKRGADSEDWTKVKLKQEIKETSTEQDAPVEVQIKEEPGKSCFLIVFYH